MNLSELHNGIMFNGKFYPCEWMDDLIDAVAKKVIERQPQQNLHFDRQDEVSYTVREVVKMLKSSNSTITLHIRLGLLKASKVGKRWIISESDYLEYRRNGYTGE